jgi:hypothetical protein
MKTNITNTLIIISLHLSVLACSKLESNDMAFKSAITSNELSSPVPGDMPDPNQNGGIVVIEEPKTEEPKAGDPVVVVDIPKVEEKAPEVVDAPKVEEKAPEVVDAPKVEEKAPEVVDAPKVEEKEILYPESEIPVCKIDVVIGGLGSASSVAVASESKDLLKNSLPKGFESLSASELAAMRSSVDSLSSSASVQVIKGNAAFDKSQFKKSSRVLVVVDGSEAHNVDMSGLGQDAQIYIMAIAKDHNTVCVRNNGSSSMAEFSMTVQGDPKYVSRASADINSNGNLSSFVKVLGGNQTGSKLKFNSMKNLALDLVTEGKDDTFSELDANFITGGKYNIKVKGKDHTGFGINTQSISDGEWNMQIEGEDEVSLLMSDVKLSNNDVHGWIKSKSGATLAQALSGSIDLMTIP